MPRNPSAVGGVLASFELPKGVHCSKDIPAHHARVPRPAACCHFTLLSFGSNLYSLKFFHCCRMAANVTTNTPPMHTHPSIPTTHHPPGRCLPPKEPSGCSSRGVGCDPQSQFSERQRRRLVGEISQPQCPKTGGE